ncbi:hypothetical protein YA28_17405 [Klebsiella aerogenes]|nr:hypothetical protein YA28_17405 [Klebsiella aerogenes]KUQ22179.1 hypothetical protein AWI09_24965 [Klebsiella aerogenes]KUR18812.1 hypothetical protein AWI35_24585 [Klebsiella aerogenes]
MTVRDAAFIHNRQRGEWGGKADEIYLNQREGAHAGQSKGLKQRRQPAHDDVENSTDFEIFHYDQHDDHNG